MLILEHYHDVKSEFDAKVPRILFKHLSRFVNCFIVICPEISSITNFPWYTTFLKQIIKHKYIVHVSNKLCLNY